MDSVCTIEAMEMNSDIKNQELLRSFMQILDARDAKRPLNQSVNGSDSKRKAGEEDWRDANGVGFNSANANKENETPGGNQNNCATKQASTFGSGLN
jgi:hypothetical protein